MLGQMQVLRAFPGDQTPPYLTEQRGKIGARGGRRGNRERLVTGGGKKTAMRVFFPLGWAQRHHRLSEFVWGYGLKKAFPTRQQRRGFPWADSPKFSPRPRCWMQIPFPNGGSRVCALCAVLCFPPGETEATPTHDGTRLGAPGSVISASDRAPGARWGGMLGVWDARRSGRVLATVADGRSWVGNGIALLGEMHQRLICRQQQRCLPLQSSA